MLSLCTQSESLWPALCAATVHDALHDMLCAAAALCVNLPLPELCSKSEATKHAGVVVAVVTVVGATVESSSCLVRRCALRVLWVKGISLYLGV